MLMETIKYQGEEIWNWSCKSSGGWGAIRKLNISFLINYIQGKMYIGSSMRAFVMLYWNFMKINIVKEAGFPFLVIDSVSCWLRDLEPECWLFHRMYGKCLDHNRQCSWANVIKGCLMTLQLWGITMMWNGGELSRVSMMDTTWASLVTIFFSSLVNFEPDIVWWTQFELNCVVWVLIVYIFVVWLAALFCDYASLWRLHSMLANSDVYDFHDVLGFSVRGSAWKEVVPFSEPSPRLLFIRTSAIWRGWDAVGPESNHLGPSLMLSIVYSLCISVCDLTSLWLTGKSAIYDQIPNFY